MPDLARPLAVPSQPCGREGVEGRAVGAEGQAGLADTGSAEHRLERADVEVFAEWLDAITAISGASSSKLLEPAGLQERDETERLDRRAEVDEVVRVAEGAEHVARDVEPRRCRPAGTLSSDGRSGPAEQGRGRLLAGLRGASPSPLAVGRNGWAATA